MHEPVADLHVLTAEVQRKIGRNLFLYQQIEGRLKYFVSVSRISGSINDIESRYQKRKLKVQRSMMGIAANEFFTTYFRDSPVNEQLLCETGVASIAITYSVVVDSTLHGQHMLAMGALVEDRNALAHKLPILWDPTSLESTLQTGSYLDEKYESAITISAFLETLRANLLQAAEAMYLSPALEQYITGGRLLNLMLEFMRTHARDGGWVSLDAARCLLNQQAREEMQNIKTESGYATLQEFAVNCGLFELRDEVGKKGGKRAVYRLKPGINLDLAEQ